MKRPLIQLLIALYKRFFNVSVLVHHSENGLILCIIMHLVVFLTGANLQGTLRSKRGLDKVILCHPILFVLCIEILAHSIRKDTQVLGLPFGEKEVKQNYADDITLFVQDIVSIRRLEFIFECFRQVSGLKLNMDKTKVLQLGCSHDSNYDFPFDQKVDVLKILGVFSHWM